MKRIMCFFLMCCLCLNVAGCRDHDDNAEGADVPEQMSEAEKEKEAFKKAEKYVKGMTLEEKLGQMFLVDADGLVKGDKPVTAISPELLGTIEKYKLGGVVFGRQNIETSDQIRILIEEIRQKIRTSADMNIPLYIGTEEEGGGQNSIAAATDSITSTGYVSPAEMGQNMTEVQLENTGEVIAEELTGLGFNLNLAPTADITQQEQPVDERAVSHSAVSAVGQKPVPDDMSGKKLSEKKRRRKWRAYQKKLKAYNEAYDAFLRTYTEENYQESCFSEDGDRAGEAAAALVKGMHTAGDRGICTVMKTFPGICSVARYHKLVNTEIETGLSRFRRENLVPFSAGIDAGTDMIMVGHVTVAKVDKQAPASLSRTIMTDMLRDEMGFEGILVTEQMDVPVITNEYSTEEAVIRAVQAGADMIYNPENLKEAVLALKQAVASGQIKEDVIDQAVLRILKNKLMRGICEVSAVEGTAVP